LVQAGSSFAYLQSIGALGQGILGAAALPVGVGVAATAGAATLAYENKENIK